MTENDRYYVICGNNQEFQNFIRRKAGDMWAAGDTSISLSNFVHLTNIRQLQGTLKPHGWFVGNWRDLSNIRDIVQMLMLRYGGFTPPDNIQNIAKELGIIK
jgi:hypothetical protein